MEKLICRISDIGIVVGGGTPSTKNPAYWGGNIPWISPKDLTDYKYTYISRGENFLTEKGLKSGTRLLPKDTVLFSSRAPIGYVALAANPICTNQGFKSIVCDSSKVEALYLYYYLKANLDYIKLFGTGATFPEISGKTMGKIKIEIHKGLDTQHRIASILSTYDTLIENNTKRIRLLEKMAENLYKEWFVRFRFPGYEKAEMENGLPKGWKVERYGEVAAIYAGGDKPKVYSKEISTECNIPIYSNGVENNGLYGFTNKATVKVSSITISARGTVGFVAIRRIPFVPIVRLLTVVPQKGLDVYYLYFASRNNDLEGNGTSQQQLTVPMLKKRKVVIPIKELLREFGNRCSLFYNQIDNLQHQNTLLARRRDLLLPRLMSGKLEVKP